MRFSATVRTICLAVSVPCQPASPGLVHIAMWLCFWSSCPLSLGVSHKLPSPSRSQVSQQVESDVRSLQSSQVRLAGKSLVLLSGWKPTLQLKPSSYWDTPTMNLMSLPLLVHIKCAQREWILQGRCERLANPKGSHRSGRISYKPEHIAQYLLVATITGLAFPTLLPRLRS
jgi:hypothetical protein